MTESTTTQHTTETNGGAAHVASLKIREQFAALFGEEGVLLVDTARNNLRNWQDLRIVLFNEASLSRLMADGSSALEDMPSLTLEDVLAQCITAIRSDSPPTEADTK